MKTNRTLAVAAFVLCVISFLAWRATTTRADRFERGQPFLANLDLDEIAQIEISKGDEATALEREDDHFVVVESNGYRARNEAVNRLLRDVTELSLERKVGAGADLKEELELEPRTENTLEVALVGTAGQEMARFRIGKSADSGQGAFILRLNGSDDSVYLTSSTPFFNTAAKTYLDSEIVNVATSEVAAVNGNDFRLIDVMGNLTLESVPRGKEQKPSAVNRVAGALSPLRFDEVYLADSAEVRDLSFTPSLTVELKDGSSYRIATARSADQVYLQIAGFHSVDRVMVRQDESDEELEQKAELLSRADEVARFNAYHGSWVYLIPQTAAEKLAMKKADLLQDLQ
jgi:hypothetical protein